MAEAKKRVYAVAVTAERYAGSEDHVLVTETRLVRAKTPAGAVAHVVKDRVTVVIPTQEEMYEHATRGLKIEDTDPVEERNGELPFA